MHALSCRKKYELLQPEREDQVLDGVTLPSLFASDAISTTEKVDFGNSFCTESISGAIERHSGLVPGAGAGGDKTFP